MRPVESGHHDMRASSVIERTDPLYFQGGHTALKVLEKIFPFFKDMESP